MFSDTKDDKTDKYIFTSNDYYIDNNSSVNKNTKYDVINSGQFGKNMESMNYNQTYGDKFYKSTANDHITRENSFNTDNKYAAGAIPTDTSSKNNINDSYNYNKRQSHKNIAGETNCSGYEKENAYCDEDYLKSISYLSIGKDKNSVDSINSKEKPIKNPHVNSNAASSSLKKNESSNFNNEFKYYRDVVEKMHDEINTLSNKLKELDKSNSLNLSRVNVSYKPNNYCGSNQNYQLDRDDVGYPSDHYKKSPSQESYNYGRLNYNYCMEENSDNYTSNTYDKTFNDQFNEPMDIVDVNKNYKVDCPPKDTRKVNPISSDKEKNEKNFKFKKIKKTFSDSNITIGVDKNKNKKSRSTSLDAKNIQLVSKNKTAIKSKAVNEKNSKIKGDIKPSISQKTLQHDSEILKENQNLKNKVDHLEKKLNHLNEQLKLDHLEKKGKDFLRIELEMWKNKSETITKNYIQTLSSLKKQIFDDKTIFVDQINSMQYEYSNEVSSLRDKYQHTLERQENSIKLHKKENENLKKKLSKLKEILI